MLADKGAQLVDLGALGNCPVVSTGCEANATGTLTADAVLVTELLELGLTPRVDELISESGIGGVGTGRSRGGLVLSLQVGDARVTTNRGNELVALYLLSVRSRVVTVGALTLLGWGAGKPWVSSHSLASDSDHDSYSQFPG